METCSRIASLNGPSANGRTSTVPRARAFGEEDHRAALSQILGALRQCVRSLASVGALHGNVAGHTHHPAHQRKAEQFRLAHPFGIELQLRDYRDVGERLVIAHDDVNPARLQILLPGDQDVPGIDPCQIAAETAEPASGAQPPRIPFQKPDDEQQRRP